MIRIIDISKSITKRIGEVLPEYKIFALNPIKNDFKTQDKCIYVLIDEVTRETVYENYELKMFMVRIFFKVHNKNNYEYYDFADTLRFNVFNDVVTIDPKINNPLSKEPPRKLMIYDWVSNPGEKICEISFYFKFQDIFRYDEPREKAEVLLIKEDE